MVKKLRFFLFSAPFILFSQGLEAGKPANDNADTAAAPSDTAATVITLEQALQIALVENASVKIADMEIKKAEYAKQGTYASLFPQIDINGSYQRTIKKQVMYMDSDSDSGGGMSGLFENAFAPIFSAIQQLSAGTGVPVTMETPSSGTSQTSSNNGFAVGRWNSFTGGLSASMPLVNFALWESLKLSGQDVELAVEKARSSRLEMVTQVKRAYFTTLMAKESFAVYKSVYENAMENLEKTRMRYNAQKASELDFTRAKTAVANAIPNVYNAESSVILSLWQLKAVMGVELDRNIDIAGKLEDYSDAMVYDFRQHDTVSLDRNSTMRQLALQAEELASNIKIREAAYLPSLSAAFAYNMMAMTNDFNFKEFQWTPYSYAALSLNIPIFSGGKRRSQVRQAKVQAAELDIQKLNTERQLKISIRQYLNTMETQMKTFSAAKEAADAAQKAYDIALKSYNVGMSTLTDLNDAQLALTQARLGVAQSVYNFIVAKANLEQTLGYDNYAEKE